MENSSISAVPNTGVLSSSDLLSLPEMIMVEMPYISLREDESAFAPFGGVDQVKSAIQSQKKILRVNFDREDPLRQSLQGKAQNTSGLVVRVRTRKRPLAHCSGTSSQTGSNDITFFDDGCTSYAVVGRVSRAYHFHRPADYQFLSSCGTADYQSCEPMAPTCAAIIEVVPRPFSISSKGAQQAASEGMFYSEVAINEEKFRKERISAAVLVNAGDPIPKQPENDFWSKQRRGANRESVNSLISTLQSLFHARPCWSRRQLDVNALARTRIYLLKELIIYEAYYFQSGALKDLWSRWSYDPAQSTLSRHYQIICVRVGASNWTALNKRVWNSLSKVRSNECINLDSLTWVPLESGEESTANTIPIILFNTQIKRQFTFQICNMCSEDLVDFVRQMHIVPEWDKAHGWFTANATTFLRHRVWQYLNERMDMFIAQCLNSGSSSSGAGSGRIQPGAPAVESAKKSADRLGFPASVWEWQKRYEDLPTVVADTRLEQTANDNQLRGALSNEFGLPSKNVASKVKLKLRPPPVAEATNSQGSLVVPNDTIDLQLATPSAVLPRGITAKKRVRTGKAPKEKSDRAKPVVSNESNKSLVNIKPVAKTVKTKPNQATEKSNPVPQMFNPVPPMSDPVQKSNVDQDEIMKSQPFNTFSSDSSDSSNHDEDEFD